MRLSYWRIHRPKLPCRRWQEVMGWMRISPSTSGRHWFPITLCKTWSGRSDSCSRIGSAGLQHLLWPLLWLLGLFSVVQNCNYISLWTWVWRWKPPTRMWWFSKCKFTVYAPHDFLVLMTCRVLRVLFKDHPFCSEDLENCRLYCGTHPLVFLCRILHCMWPNEVQPSCIHMSPCILKLSLAFKTKLYFLVICHETVHQKFTHFDSSSYMSICACILHGTCRLGPHPTFSRMPKVSHNNKPCMYHICKHILVPVFATWWASWKSDITIIFRASILIPVIAIIWSEQLDSSDHTKFCLPRATIDCLIYLKTSSICWSTIFINIFVFTVEPETSCAWRWAWSSRSIQIRKGILTSSKWIEHLCIQSNTEFSTVRSAIRCCSRLDKN